MTTNPLAHKAVLASLHITRWRGKRVDRQITDDVHVKYNADASSGKYIKRLMQRDAFAALSSICTAARSYHNTRTLPWMDGGTRILPSMLYVEYAGQMQFFRQQFEEASAEFVRQYPKLKANARRTMNGLFREEDYPRVEEIGGYFSLGVSILPCPDAEDFRTALDADALKEIKREASRELQGILTAAQNDACQRIADVVGHMAARLREYRPAPRGGKAQNVFRDSLVENVRELAELLPAFNMTDDKRLTAIIGQVKKQLCIADAEILRNDDAIRESVLQQANAVLKSVSAFMA